MVFDILHLKTKLFRILINPLPDINDQDFILAFETNSQSFKILSSNYVKQVSRYIVKDTPMIPCVRKNIGDIVKSLG